MMYFKIVNDNAIDKSGAVVWSGVSTSPYHPFDSDDDVTESSIVDKSKKAPLSIDKIIQLSEAGFTHDQIIDMESAGVI